jgi:hypothetical protein
MGFEMTIGGIARTTVWGLVCLIHCLHASRDAPQTFDEPDFAGKMISVALVFAAFAIAHMIQKEEDNLKSTC